MTAMSETLLRRSREVLTRENIAGIDAVLDREGVYAKGYTQTVGGKLTIVGLRIGVKPDHVVAFYGDTIIRGTDGSYSVQPASEMTAARWNYLHPVGTQVVAYPCTRYCPEHPGLETATRTPAWELGHGQPVVSVEGRTGGIALTHVDLRTGGGQ